MTPATRSATHAVLDSSSDGSTTKPNRQRSGSATKPLSRSSATEANAVSLDPMFLADRLMRRTSPPIVDGSTLPTNWPAK